MPFFRRFNGRYFPTPSRNSPCSYSQIFLLCYWKRNPDETVSLPLGLKNRVGGKSDHLAKNFLTDLPYCLKNCQLPCFCFLFFSSLTTCYSCFYFFSFLFYSTCLPLGRCLDLIQLTEWFGHLPSANRGLFQANRANLPEGCQITGTPLTSALFRYTCPATDEVTLHPAMRDSKTDRDKMTTLPLDVDCRCQLNHACVCFVLLLHFSSYLFFLFFSHSFGSYPFLLCTAVSVYMRCLFAWFVYFKSYALNEQCTNRFGLFLSMNQRYPIQSS